MSSEPPILRTRIATIGDKSTGPNCSPSRRKMRRNGSVTSLIFSFGVRVPYLRPVHAVLDFLRDVCEPFLRIFRRLGLQIGPLDLSPIVALLVLRIVGGLIIGAIRP